MSYLASLKFITDKEHPFPYSIPAIKHAKDIALSDVNFIVGDNGTGKSTLLETLAYRLQLPHMDGYGYQKSGFEASKILLPYLELEWNIERSTGFFFRAEDFGDYLNSVQRKDTTLHNQLEYLQGDVPEHILKEMKDNANDQLHRMRKDYGQELETFSHGEAYLHIMQQKINQRGIYLLDEPEAALSPAKQLQMLFFIHEHLQQHMSQFIIATHSPMLMAYPEATLYEITENYMEQKALEDTEHYSITKSFLNNPNAYLRRM